MPGRVHGKWDPALAPLAEAFAASIESGQERGGLCVMRDGAVLLEMWGGEATPGRPWRRGTLACCFSVTKGVLSLLAHVLIDRGLLALNAPVARLWPELAQGGKADITLRDVLTHRAGLPAVDGPVARGDLYSWQRMTDHLACSAPVVPPRAAPVYHNMTYGHLLGEILCRASGLRPLPLLLKRVLIDRVLPDHASGSFALGLDPGLQTYCARLTQEDPQDLFAALQATPDSLFARSMAFFGEGEDFNTARWRGAVIGSGSGHATARGLAALYGQLVWPDAVISPARQAALRKEAAVSDGDDPILGIPIRYGQGVELSTPPGLDFGPDPAVAGHWGAGGAQAFADPATRVSFGYVTGHMSRGLGSSARAQALVQALDLCNLQKTG
ncbi:MAG: serine hydrolase domain-containing protein [Pseudomonadota bacterium]